MIKEADLDKWVHRYGAAWTQGDPAAAEVLFSPTATYYETPFDQPFTGRAAIREYWSQVPQSQKDITFSSRKLAIAGEIAIVHWRAAFTRIETDKRVELDGIFVLGFDETGLCTELREWWHLRDLP
jgi:hypothetical protein